MYIAIKNREDLENLEELASLKTQVEEFRLQDKLGKQNYHQDTNNLFEPLTDAIKGISGILTKTITETYNKYNKAIENLNGKVLDLTNDKGMIAPYLTSSLVNLLKLENKSQFRLIKDPNSTELNDILINTSVPVTLYSKMLSFGDSNESLS